MIDGLKPYKEYRESAHPWLGEVPAHWGEKRAKYFYREVDERSASGEEELMSVSHKTGVTPRKAHVTMFMAESNAGHKVCRPDDLVINTMWAFMAALGVARQVGVVSPSYGVYRPIRRTELHPDYVDRLLRIEDYKSEYLCRSTGIRSSRLRLYPDQFLRIPIVCPPPEEQAAIVRFLDHVDRRIRRYIRAKRQLIALLNEQKQAIIHRVVTRGLDPNVRLKPSGVEWLGDVPETWQVVPLCSIAKPKKIVGKQDRELLSVYLDRGVIPFSEVQEKRTNVTSEDLSKYQAVDPGDFVLNNQQAWRGSVGVSRHAGIVSPAYLVLSLDSRINPDYANMLFRDRTMVGQYLVSSKGVGTIQRNLYWPHLKRVSTLLPPPGEQAVFVEYLDDATADNDVTIGRASREIELMREYRTRLISDVVTGKLDVWKAATRLPEEVDEGATIADELLEGEDVIDDAGLDVKTEEVEA